MNLTFYDVNDVMGILGSNRAYAYKVIRSLNAELEQNGVLVMAGKVNKDYFESRFTPAITKQTIRLLSPSGDEPSPSCTQENTSLRYGRRLDGSDGRLVKISDERILCEFVGKEPLTTLDEALDTSLEVRVGRWDGRATVEEVRLGYFMEESGYLVPVWVLDGHLQSQNGEQVDWRPEILALK